MFGAFLYGCAFANSLRLRHAALSMLGPDLYESTRETAASSFAPMTAMTTVRIRPR